MSALDIDAIQRAFQKHEHEKHDVPLADVIPIPADCLRDVKRNYDAEMNTVDSPDFFCVCPEEMCFCTNPVPGVEQACTTCARGNHKWQM